MVELFDSTEKEKNKIREIKKQTRKPLYEIAQVFPFALFPDSIAVDKTKVDITYKGIFNTRRVFPILIADLRNVTVDKGIFFACMRFEIMFKEKNPEPVCFLPARQAVEMAKIIMGLVAAEEKNVDLKKLSFSETRESAKEIGQPHY